MPRKSAKDTILDAAETVIARQGMAATTVEAVAAEAGVSKGGLFYHFSSKRDLLLQLLHRFQDKYYTLRDEIYAGLPETPHRLLKASILASIQHPAKYRSSLSNILTLLDDAELRGKVADMKRNIFREASAGSTRPELAGLAFLAIDGLWLHDLFSDSCYEEDFRQKIISELLRLVDVLGNPENAAGAAARAAEEDGVWDTSGHTDSLS